MTAATQARLQAEAVNAARSFLFVPGNRPERFLKAAQSGADAIVLDLEDAVPLAEKAQARSAIAAAWPALAALPVPLVVRINASGSAAGEDDVALLAALPGLAAAMVPKADHAAALTTLAAQLPAVPLLPLIESAAGYYALREIAAARGVARLALGHIDFMADVGFDCDETQGELAPLRFAMAMATRESGLAPAIDGVTVQTGDDAQLQRDTRRALRFGFGGKLCIHPRQIEGVHAAMMPTATELDWAQRVIAADAQSGGAAVQLDGRMIDHPVVLQARCTLARARPR